MRTLGRHQFDFSMFNELCRYCLQHQGLTISLWRAANSLGNSLWCFERYSRNSLGQLFHKTKPISRHWGGFYLMSETGDRIKEAVPGGTTNTKGFVKNDRKTYHCRSFLKHPHAHILIDIQWSYPVTGQPYQIPQANK